MKHFYFTGPDGSGKSTYIQMLEDYLQEKGMTSYYIWIRSPKILSKPLMLYCRIMGYTKYKYIDGIKYGVHEFYKSKFISSVFPIIQFIDFYIRNYLNKRKINKNKDLDVVIYDRQALDTLADLMVGTHRFNLHKTYIGKKFIKILPKNIKIVVLQATEETIKKRKLDTLYDANLATKIKVYKILQVDLNLTPIDNNRRELDFVFSDIKSAINLD